MKPYGSGVSWSLFLVIAVMAPVAVCEEPPTFKETPQEYGLVFQWAGNPGDQARIQARSGGKVFAAAEESYVIERERAYRKTGAYPADDSARVAATVKKKQAVFLSNGTKIEFVRSWVNTADEVLTGYSQVRVLSGPSKDKVAWIGQHECFAFEPFSLKAGDEAMLSKGRLMSYATGVAVVGEIPAYNALLRSWRDGEPDKSNAQARKAESVRFQEPGTKVRIQAVACSPDRTDHYGLAGAAVSVEVLDGPDRGKTGWAFPESVLRSATADPTEGVSVQGRAVVAGPPKAAAAAGWQAMKSEKNSFIVEMPGQPNIKDSESIDGAEVSTLGFRTRGLELLLVAAIAPTEISDAGETEALHRLRDRAARKLGGNVEFGWERSETLGSLRTLGFGFKIAKPSVGQVEGRGHAVAVRKNAYVLFVVCPTKNQTTAKDELRFFNSFAVIGHVAAALAERDRHHAKPAEKNAGATWGKEIDPGDDVAIDESATSLAMNIPGSPHVLAPERDIMNAPRVVAPVEGDFVVHVRVDGLFQPSSKSTVKGLSSRQAGGLIVWKDSKNYLVFQHRATSEGGYVTHQAVLEELVAGSKGVTRRQAIPEGAMSLRLERKRGRIAAAYSKDGQEWKELQPVDTTWAEGELQVGVVAVSTSTGAHPVKFDGYSLQAR
jgi:regulation of enolase protein 1 (concanavalin A-like superfamily)